MQTVVDKIRELRALHEDGLLSHPEFEARKRAILDAAHAPPAAAMPAAGTELGLMAGQLLGPANRRYRLERLIAHGGMAQVWQATDLATQTELGHSAQVALKILSPELTESAAHARLLLQEATRARRLAHEHIVRVYDWAQDPATSSFFLIMECLEGEDLERLLAREAPLPLARVLDLLAPVGAALDYAWDRHGLVHRDIKPANLFLTRRGEVKLLDFGIAARARAAGLNGEGAHAPGTSGTPGYRAPEAGAPDLVPARSLDVHAVARMVLRMVSAQDPSADSAPSRPDAIGAAAWEVLRSGWAAVPAQRPESVSALLAGLRAVAGLEVLAQKAPVATADDPSGVETPFAQQVDAEADAPAAGLVNAEGEAPAGAAPVPAPPQAPAADETTPQASPDAVAASPTLAPLPAPRIEAGEQVLSDGATRERAQPDPARDARRQALREQLMAHRAQALASSRQAQDDAARRAAQERAAAAYLAEQARTRALAGAVADAAAGPASAPVSTPGAAGAAVLCDRFLDGTASGPELVVIRAGRFQMGSPEHERRIALAAGLRAHWLARETPQHWVGIERPFALGRYPVTVGQWRAFATATGWQGSGKVDWDAPGFPQADAHPVVGINWHDALAYLDWLGVRTGRRYRLPSEAEWEYACRAGTRGAFHFGEAIDPGRANYDGRFAWNGGTLGAFRGGTTPVTQFAPNPWGLHDMHGNVWEWLQDVLHDSYEGAPRDGRAWEDGGDAAGNAARRVLRGGCWRYQPGYLRSALRNGFSGALSSDVVGFRVARELDEGESVV